MCVCVCVKREPKAMNLPGAAKFKLIKEIEPPTCNATKIQSTGTAHTKGPHLMNQEMSCDSIPFFQ